MDGGSFLNSLLTFSEEEGVLKKKKIKKDCEKLTKNFKKTMIGSIRKKNLIRINLLKIVSIICFSLIVIFLSGCFTLRSDKEKWPLPPKPNLLRVDFVPISAMTNIDINGYYLSRTNALNLANNFDEIHAYVKKLEILIDKMKE